MMSPKVLVTGAGGFVGEALVFRLLQDGNYRPIAAVRGQTRLLGLCPVQSFDLLDEVRTPALEDVQIIVHAAARVHVMQEQAEDVLAEFRRINVDGTLRLARRAVSAGVKRFIFISSIKVNGETTIPGKPFTADDAPRPLDPYSVSKLEAELALMQLGRDSGMEVVIIRPSLVYGPGVKANFRSMMEWLDKGIPLPLGSIRNRRSLVSVANLVSLIIACLDHPAAANQVFLVSDGIDLSTTQLLRHLSSALGRVACLIPFPASLLTLVASLLGRRAIAQKVCSSLQVDINKNREILGWAPPVGIGRAMLQTARHYKDEKAK